MHSIRHVCIWAVSCKKVPNILSRCHTKRRTGAIGRTIPSFGMTLTFQKKKLKFVFSKSKSKKSVSYQKKRGRGHVRPSFFWYDNDSEHLIGTFLHDAGHVCSKWTVHDVCSFTMVTMRIKKKTTLGYIIEVLRFIELICINLQD